MVCHQIPGHVNTSLKAYAGANFALLCALSGFAAECSYATRGCPESRGATTNLHVIQWLYQKLLRLIRIPFPPILFFHGLLVAPARFASRYTYLVDVRFLRSSTTLTYRPTLPTCQGLSATIRPHACSPELRR